MSKTEIKPIAHIYTPFSEKFGIPRQSGLINQECVIVFEPEFRNPDAVRGLEGFSHLWLIWQFSKAVRKEFVPTVRPPRLGGNKKVGVFATRSPFRPNSLGLSSVKLKSVVLNNEKGPLIYVEGADILDGTPIFDIKPYLAYTDSHPDAITGLPFDESTLFVEYLCDTSIIESNLLNEITEMLSLDPRPHYQNNPDREYGVKYREYNIKFKVCDDILSVCSISLSKP